MFKVNQDNAKNDTFPYTFKYHVSCTDGKISVRINYINYINYIKQTHYWPSGQIDPCFESRDPH